MKIFIVAFVAFVISMPFLGHADPISDMRDAESFLQKKDWQKAWEAAPEGVARDFVTWSRLRAGEGDLGDYEGFLNRHSDWPGLRLLRRQGETAVARSQTPSRVVNYFADYPPQTGPGVVALVKAYLALDRPGQAESTFMQAWTDLPLSAEIEDELRRLMPEASQIANEARLDTMLWRGERDAATRMLDHVSPDMRKLAAARIALRADAPGVNALIDAVPASLQDDPGLLYERFTWRMRRDLYNEAAELLLSQAPDQLGQPELWAPRRGLLARWLLRNERKQDAYKAAANHGLSDGTHYADLEFLAGFIALRHLNQPQTALSHFARLRAGVSTPISIARADYWQGRAAEAQNDLGAANAHYKNAARHQTTYYGLLAAEKLGQSLDPSLLQDEPRSDWRAASFTKSPLLTLSRLLLATGNFTEARRFLLHLAESQSPEQIEQMADMALELDQPNLALLLAKQAAERGHIVSRSYFPLTDLVPDGLKAPRALALSIARRESEFYPQARSSADARGLMQVLPETAKRMAKGLNLEYREDKLYDPAFNAQVGAAYLANMSEQFGPSVALIASGYNAGPGRPKRWMNDFGDPRRPEIDIVDWVETIPFGETRTYVMRVAEGMVIYGDKLAGRSNPVRITDILRGTAP